MQRCTRHIYQDVDSYELGWSPYGKPLMTVRFYIAGDVLIDTGQSHMRSVILDILSAKQLAMAVLTHHHEDHGGNAQAIHNQHNIPVMVHPLAIAKMSHPFKIRFYQHYVWGQSEPTEVQPLPEIIETPRVKLKPLHTPGHSKDHVVYLEPDRGWLFSGDLYLGDRIKYFRHDERIKDQIDSLRNILNYEFEALFCAHNPQIVDGKARLAAKLQYLEDIYGQVAQLWEQGLRKEKVIFDRLKLKEAKFVKWFSCGNVSMLNMVRSITKQMRSEIKA